MSLAERVAARFKEKKETDAGNTVYVYSPRQISRRNSEKAKRLKKLHGKLKELRTQVRKDLGSKDDKTRQTALVVALMDETFERVGNPNSADEGHFGVTGWRKSHVKFSGGKATISYVGKSGVKQTKTVTTPEVVSALKKAVEAAEGEEGAIFRVGSSDVNAYLPEGFTAKDIRGLHANKTMREALKRAKPKSLPTDKKEREKALKESFKKALEETAKAVGHEPQTLRGQYLVPGLAESYLKDGTIEGPMKTAARFEINQAFIDRLRKDFLTLIGNLKRIKTERDEEQVRAGFRTWKKHFNKVIFEDWLNNKDVKGESYGWSVRKPAWDFYLELDMPRQRADWKKWEQRLRRKSQSLWKELKYAVGRWEETRRMELQHGLEGESLTPAPHGESASEERVTLEGFDVLLKGMQERDYQARRDQLEKFKAELKRYKGQAAKHFPLLLKAKVPIHFDYTMGLEKGGDYDLYDRNKLRVNPLSTTGEKEPAYVLAHEMGHHIYKTYLGGKALELWKAMIDGTTDLDLGGLLGRWPAEIEYTDDFVKYMSRQDPLYALRVDVASGWDDTKSLWKRENFQELLDGGTRSVKVPAVPISAYAGKNEEEAFCEAVGLLVSRGPRGLHPKVRWVLSLMFPGQLKMAARVVARSLESLVTLPQEQVDLLEKTSSSPLRHQRRSGTAP